MSPYNAQGPLELIGLLLKIENEKKAIQKLMNLISDLQDIGLGEIKEAQSLIMKLKDVERNKMYKQRVA